MVESYQNAVSVEEYNIKLFYEKGRVTTMLELIQNLRNIKLLNINVLQPLDTHTYLCLSGVTVRSCSKVLVLEKFLNDPLTTRKTTSTSNDMSHYSQEKVFTIFCSTFVVNDSSRLHFS